MSNREFKEKLYQNDPRCHWCRRVTKLTNIPAIQGMPDPLMATIDHLVSRYHPQRWVKRSVTKVLACYECNARRAKEETLALPRAELVRRSQGFSLNPRGKPIFIEALDSLDQVLDKMEKHGIILHNETTVGPTCGPNGDGDCSTS